MDYKIRIYKIEKEDSNLRGFVTVSFEDSFCVKQIALKESRAGNLYLESPKYQEYESKEYLDYFSFHDREFLKNVLEEIRDAYQETDEKMIDLESEWGDDEMEYALNVVPLQGRRDFKAEVDLKVHDVLVVHKLHVIKPWTGKLFVGMPQKLNTRTGKRDNIANPINAEFRKELETAVLDLYQKQIDRAKVQKEKQK